MKRYITNPEMDKYEILKKLISLGFIHVYLKLMINDILEKENDWTDLLSNWDIKETNLLLDEKIIIDLSTIDQLTI